jgi:replicative DNA helicase
MTREQASKPEAPRFTTPEEARTEWVKSFENRDVNRFFRSGFAEHDQTAGAFLRGGLYLPVARTGVGKTSWMLSVAYRQAKNGTKVFFGNFEMNIPQMWTRLACLHDKTLTLKELNEGDLTPAKIARIVAVADKLTNFSPWFCEDTNLKALIGRAMTEIAPSSNSLLFIDYVGLLTLPRFDAQERYHLISECARTLKRLARALDIPLVAAVQLNRNIENRKDKTPTLADLRDSGELEQHADCVLALTRERDDRLDVIVLKNRHGPRDVSYSLSFDGPRAAVEDLD